MPPGRRSAATPPPAPAPAPAPAPPPAAAGGGAPSITTNQGKDIITATTAYVAHTVQATDILWKTPDKKALKSHVNYIHGHLAPPAQTTTSQTVCRGQRIVHDETNIGNDFGLGPSVNPGFEGLGGGILNGGVYHKHANPLKGQCSPDCKVEGKPVARHHDPTKQNKANTEGMFLRVGEILSTVPLDQIKANRCALTDLEVKCTDHGRVAVSGRLEVLEGNFVTFKFERIDATATGDARKTPKCQIPLAQRTEHELQHPIVQVFRKKHSLPTNDYDEKKDKKTTKRYVLDKDWVGDAPQGAPGKPTEHRELAPGEKAAGLAPRAAAPAPGAPPPPGAMETYERTRAQQDEARSRENRRIGPTVERVGPTHSEAINTGAISSGTTPAAMRGQPTERSPVRRPVDNDGRVAAIAADQAAARRANDLQDAFRQQEIDQRIATARQADELAAAYTKISAAVETIIDLAGLVRAWNAKPMEIQMEAIACAGALTTTVGVYPRKTFILDFVKLDEVRRGLEGLQKSIDLIKSYLTKIKDFRLQWSMFETQMAPVDRTADARFILFNKPILSFGFEFRELQRDARNDGEEDPKRKKHQVHRAWWFEVGVATVIGVGMTAKIPIVRFAPAIGEIGNILLRIANVDLDIEITVDIGVGVTAQAGRDEYGDLAFQRVVLTPRAIFSIGIVAKAGKLAEASGSVVGTIEMPMCIDVDRGVALALKRLSATVRLDFVGKAEVNLFGWKVGGSKTVPIVQPVHFREAILYTFMTT